MIKFFLSILLTLTSTYAAAASSDADINEYVRRDIRVACINQISSLQPKAFRGFKVSPADFCDCIAGNHTLWARRDIGDSAAANAYLKAILALYTPRDAEGQARVQRKYAAEFDNDMNYATKCNRK